MIGHLNIPRKFAFKVNDPRGISFEFATSTIQEESMFLIIITKNLFYILYFCPGRNVHVLICPLLFQKYKI
jgi:hypothetical protein